MKAGVNWSGAAISDRFPRVQGGPRKAPSVVAQGGLKEGTGRVRTSPPTSQGGCSDPGCTCTSCAGAARAFWSQARHPRTQSDQPQGAGRTVSGDWLAEVMRLDPETSQRIAGQQVELDAEAWGAVRAAQRARASLQATRASTARRRREIFEEGPFPTSCRCTRPEAAGGLRYVDSELGDDHNTGRLSFVGHRPRAGGAAGGTWTATLAPWKTLRMVERWLSELTAAAGGSCVAGAEVYLRQDRVWNGLEEKNADATAVLDGSDLGLVYLDWDLDLATPKTILEIVGFKATEDAPLILSSYNVGSSGRISRGSSATAADKPLISGQADAKDPGSAESIYQDNRMAISIVDCCQVAVSDLRIRSFKTGVEVRGHSKHHTYSGLDIANQARSGFVAYVAQEDAGYNATSGWYTTGRSASLRSQVLARSIQAIVDAGDYPEYIEISGSTFTSIGYDTAGLDVGLGFLATNCTVRDNTMEGDALRGLDGVELVGASSGHLIAGNTIRSHAKFCRLTDRLDHVEHTYQADFHEDAMRTLFLYHPCTDGQNTDATNPTDVTDYGYTEQFYSYEDYSDGTGLPYDTANDKEAFGENGICLKAARVRTPTSMSTTVIRDNLIYGNHAFAGISVYEGSQGVRIHGNRIFQNSVGIGISNRNNNAWYNDGDRLYYLEKTKDIHVYDNLIYMNEEEGVFIHSDADVVTDGPDASSAERVFQVADVFVYRNVIAYNLYVGARVSNQAGVVGDVDNIALFGNLIMRNARGMGEKGRDYTYQAYWEGEMYLHMELHPLRRVTGYSDYNCYLGWVTPDILWSDLHENKVIYLSNPYPVSATMEEATAIVSMESNGTQLTDLADVGFTSAGALAGWEGSNGYILSDSITDADNTADFMVLDFSRAACPPLDWFTVTSILRSLGVDITVSVSAVSVTDIHTSTARHALA